MPTLASLASSLGQVGNFLAVVLGFSLIIVLHELGHFLAARWAKIRVLAFAVGFGPALFSFRKGLGWRLGSSESEYNQTRKAWTEGAGKRNPEGISTTEYRLNALPFGGYVKMLGQEDIDPSARSNEPDSYQNCKPWKRMIVISAGVVANVVTAAILFVVVFMLGLRIEPAKIGHIEGGSPASTAVALNASAAGIQAPGLKPGDTVLSINGKRALSFNDIGLASMLARRGEPIAMTVQREGVSQPLHFSIIPEVEPLTKVLFIGAGFAVSNQLRQIDDPATAAQVELAFARLGIDGLKPGMKLVEVDGKPARSAYDLDEAATRNAGKPVTSVFEDAAGKRMTFAIPSQPRMDHDSFAVTKKEVVDNRHILGLQPLLRADEVVKNSPGEKAGLRADDVFIQIGDIRWPSVPAGFAEIKAHAGKPLAAAVLRRDDHGVWREVVLSGLQVGRDGRIGFNIGHSAADGAWIGALPATESALPAPARKYSAPPLEPGSVVLAVDGTPINSLLEVREVLSRTALARADARRPMHVTLTVRPPQPAAEPREVAWEIPTDQAAALTLAAFESRLEPAVFFEPEQIRLVATGPADAINMGLSETRRVMWSTYLTFARLFQGTVKVAHLKGPVGIAHVGTILADRGAIWLLFFMALISVNLAVVNFLPLPIVDGGHFIFLLYEQFTGRPVSVAVQNFATLAGLIFIGTMFLIVTFNDIKNLFGG